MTSIIEDLATAASILAVLIVAFEFGFRSGRRATVDADAKAGAQAGAIQGAILGLLGLLLAFSFGAAGARFLERQDLIVREANAIGTAYLRADLLGEPERTELRAALASYTKHRIEIPLAARTTDLATVSAEVDAHHARIWKAASAGVAARPGSMLGVLPPVNEVIDLHSTRLAASLKHLPLLVTGLLLASSLVALWVIGFGCGLTGRRRAPLTLPLALLIGTSLWITYDLDHPRQGLLRLSDAPLEALKFDPPPK